MVVTVNVAKSSSQANYCKYAVKNIFTDTLRANFVVFKHTIVISNNSFCFQKKKEKFNNRLFVSITKKS